MVGLLVGRGGRRLRNVAKEGGVGDGVNGKEIGKGYAAISLLLLLLLLLFLGVIGASDVDVDLRCRLARGRMGYARPSRNL